jgi:ADP-ribosylglycohydrolase
MTVPMKPEWNGDPLSAPGSVLIVCSRPETGEFVGLYALTPTDGSFIRGDGLWHTAAGKALSQVNFTKPTVMNPLFVYAFDPVDVAGGTPSAAMIAAFSLPIEAGSPSGQSASACVTAESSPPAAPTAASPAGGPQQTCQAAPVGKPGIWSEKRGLPNFKSRVRGLLLGLALGDSVGSHSGHVPPSGPLAAGVASQLAAWTVEGTLRAFTRYAEYFLVQPHLVDPVRYAYQRWGALRGLKPPHDGVWFGLPGSLDDDPQQAQRLRGWLADEPTIAHVRGSSPSTEHAIVAERPVRSMGCQAMLRALPVAPLAFVGFGANGTRLDAIEAREHTEDYARNVALITHDDDDNQNTTALAIRVLWECLKTEQDLATAIHPLFGNAERYGTAAVRIHPAALAARHRPRSTEQLAGLAPKKESRSALRGGLYAALSYPGEDMVADAIAFASKAPDGDSVAAVAGAILGARHGYEALPIQWLGRLELGWAIDRLACDLAAELVEHQGGALWMDYGPSGPDVVDPWWDLKYPGA